MSDETSTENLLDSNNNILEYNSESNSSGSENSGVEAQQNKSKRKYTRREQKENSEFNRIRHSGNRLQEQSTAGSTVQQSRKKRQRSKRRKQDIANELGLVTDGFTNAKPVPRSRKPRKPRKDPIREINGKQKAKLSEESDLDGSSSDENYEVEDISMEDFIRTLRPVMMPRIDPTRSILNKVTSAFLGCPVMTHVSESRPGNTKLVIEIEI